MKIDDDHKYRRTSLVNNRKNNRANGMSGPKRIKSYLHTGECCRFSFIVKWDIFGFYVQLEFKSGTQTHCNHPQIDKTLELPYPTRFLTADQIKHTKAVVEDHQIRLLDGISSTNVFVNLSTESKLLTWRVES